MGIVILSRADKRTFYAVSLDCSGLLPMLRFSGKVNHPIGVVLES